MHPLLGDLLDSGEIDFSVMQIFEEFVKHSEHGLVATSLYARNELFLSPLFQALFDCNIIWKSKYYDYVNIEHKLFAKTMQTWVDSRKAAMNPHDRIMYYLFKKTKGIKLGSYSSGVEKTNNKTFSKKEGAKIDAGWEVRELYFDVGLDKDDT